MKKKSQSESDHNGPSATPCLLSGFSTTKSSSSSPSAGSGAVFRLGFLVPAGYGTVVFLDFLARALDVRIVLTCRRGRRGRRGRRLVRSVSRPLAHTPLRLTVTKSSSPESGAGFFSACSIACTLFSGAGAWVRLTDGPGALSTTADGVGPRAVPMGGTFLVCCSFGREIKLEVKLRGDGSHGG